MVASSTAKHKRERPTKLVFGHRAQITLCTLTFGFFLVPPYALFWRRVSLVSVSKTGLITSVTWRCKAFLSGSPGGFFFAGYHFPQLSCFLVRCSQIAHVFSHLVYIVDILSNCSPIVSMNFLYGFGGKTPSTTYSFCDLSIVKKRFLLGTQKLCSSSASPFSFAHGHGTRTWQC